KLDLGPLSPPSDDPDAQPDLGAPTMIVSTDSAPFPGLTLDVGDVPNSQGFSLDLGGAPAGGGFSLDLGALPPATEDAASAPALPFLDGSPVAEPASASSPRLPGLDLPLAAPAPAASSGPREGTAFPGGSFGPGGADSAVLDLDIGGATPPPT